MAEESANPTHYTSHDVSPIDLMAAYDLAEPFARGSAIKHLARGPEKDGATDYLKAVWYSAYLAGLAQGLYHTEALALARRVSKAATLGESA